MKKLQCCSICHEDCLSVSEWPWRLCPHFHFSMSNSFSVMFEQSVLFALQYWSKWLFTCTNTSQWIIHKNKHLAPRLKPFHFAISKAWEILPSADGENRVFDCSLISENKNAVWNWNIDLLHCNHLVYYTRDSMCEQEYEYLLSGSLFDCWQLLTMWKHGFWFPHSNY